MLKHVLDKMASCDCYAKFLPLLFRILDPVYFMCALRKKILFVYLLLVAGEFFSPRVQSVILEHVQDVVTCSLFGVRVGVNIPCFAEVVQYRAQRLGLSTGFNWARYCQTN